jgi:hypothetical protein
LPKALGKEIFFKKNKKIVFADDLCQVRSAQDFLKKIEKQPLPTAFDRGTRHRFFQKNPLPTAFASRSRHNFFQKK